VHADGIPGNAFTLIGVPPDSTMLSIHVAQGRWLGARDRNVLVVSERLLRDEPDLVVGDNEPYAVSDETDYTIPVHGEARGLMNSGIEIRQDLIADQAGERLWADRLARILAEIETTLRAQRLLPV